MAETTSNESDTDAENSVSSIAIGVVVLSRVLYSGVPSLLLTLAIGYKIFNLASVFFQPVSLSILHIQWALTTQE